MAYSQHAKRFTKRIGAIMQKTEISKQTRKLSMAQIAELMPLTEYIRRVDEEFVKATQQAIDELGVPADFAGTLERFNRRNNGAIQDGHTNNNRT